MGTGVGAWQLVGRQTDVSSEGETQFPPHPVIALLEYTQEK